MTTFLDSCVVIALLNDQDRPHDWSVEEVAKCKTNGPAIICDIVYCEASVAMKSRGELDEAIVAWGLERIRSPDDALFRAGKAFLRYRSENKGQKLGVMPDFLIGATAEVQNAPLITDNKKDFMKYFPTVAFIAKS